jgi:putative IMPACT (imprinted ancient) family translation regulator
MLNVLAGRTVSDALVVAVRWFGGVKLGKGGLARAYGATARRAVESAQLIERFPTVTLVVQLPYERLGAVKRLVRSPEVEIEKGVYGERVRLTLRVAESVLREVEGTLADLGVAVEPT